MSAYGSISYTRKSRSIERVMSASEKKTVAMLESQLKSLQRQHSALYEDDDLDDAELKKLQRPIQDQIDALINQISDIKYTTR